MAPTKNTATSTTAITPSTGTNVANGHEDDAARSAAHDEPSPWFLRERTRSVPPPTYTSCSREVRDWASQRREEAARPARGESPRREEARSVRALPPDRRERLSPWNDSLPRPRSPLCERRLASVRATRVSRQQRECSRRESSWRSSAPEWEEGRTEPPRISLVRVSLARVERLRALGLSLSARRSFLRECDVGRLCMSA